MAFSVVATAFVLIFWPSGDNSRLLALAWAIAAVLCVIPSLIQYFGLTRFDFFGHGLGPLLRDMRVEILDSQTSRQHFLGLDWLLCFSWCA